MYPPGSLRKVEMFSRTFCVLFLLVLFGERSPRFKIMMRTYKNNDRDEERRCDDDNNDGADCLGIFVDNEDNIQTSRQQTDIQTQTHC